MPLRYAFDGESIDVLLVLYKLLNLVLKGDDAVASFRPPPELGLPTRNAGGRSGVDKSKRSAALSPASDAGFKAAPGI